VSLFGYGLQINALVEFHIFCMNSKDLKSADLVRYSDVDFSIESSKSSKSWVKRIRSVGSSDDYDVTSALESVHKSQKLRHDSSLDLSVNFFSVGCNRIDLIDKDNGWTVFFCFLESFSEITFGFSGHLGHDLRSVNEEKKGSSLVSDSSSN